MQTAFPVPLWAWIGVFAFVLAMLALDLGVFHRKAHRVSLREAAAWTTVWVGTASLFGALVWTWMGPEKGIEFITGYVVEWSLSVDNLFVFLLIFSYFAVPIVALHRVLFYGILGAIIMRGIFIAGGIALLALFHWIIYVFGAFLILTGIKMAFQPEAEMQPEKNPVLRLARRWLPMTSAYEGQRFFVKRGGRRLATPLFLVLLVVESTDVIFAVDSVPAILAITRGPFIVYTSNIFAILGLRSVFFLVAGVIEYFQYLRYGLAAVLVFVGVKMLLADVYKFPGVVSLGIIMALIGISMLASYLAVRWRPEEAEEADAKPRERARR